MKPFFPWDVDIAICSAFIMAIAITDFNGFFEFFGPFSFAFRIVSFGMGVMTGIIWVAETAMKFRKIRIEEETI